MNQEIQTKIINTVNERGFYLYEWISEEEFRKSIRLDYFSLLEKFGTAIAIFSLVATFLGGIYAISSNPDVFVEILNNRRSDDEWAVIVLFFWAAVYASPYTIGSILIGFLLLLIPLTIKTIAKGNMYRKTANITIVDNHVVTHENIIPHQELQNHKSIKKIAKLFHEQPFNESYLNQAIQTKEELSLNKISGFWTRSINFANKLQEMNKNFKRNPVSAI